ncbi:MULTISPECIES: O-antigen ligase family protein [Prochlorococcus]|nr:O-antigen ligase family protein [Prochlorococcus marinus]
MLTNNFLKYAKKNYLNIGKYSFLIGVFLLPTAFVISALFLLFSLVLSFSKSKLCFLKDKLNLLVIIAIGMILFSSLINNTILIPRVLPNLDNSFVLLNLFNWIPPLLGFIGFQSYVKTEDDRLIFSKYLLSGTVPFIVSCLFQLFFDLHGPFQIFNGLIIWFQKPLEVTGGVSGLFSNRNYAGIWLSINLPFGIYLIKKNIKYKIKSLSILFITFLISYLIINTNSKNALLSMISTIIVFFGIKTFFIFSIGIIFFFVILNLLPTLNILEFIPETFLRIKRFTFFINTPRLVIFRSALNFIFQRPFLGWGSGTFALIYLAKDNMWNPPFVFHKFQHTHNLFLEMAFNFGIPISILLTSIAFYIFYKSLKVFYSNDKKDDYQNLNKAWISAGIVIFLIHLSDMTFYDGRVSMLICILFSGLRCISLTKNNLKICN